MKAWPHFILSKNVFKRVANHVERVGHGSADEREV